MFWQEFNKTKEEYVMCATISFVHTVMDKNIGTPALLSDNAPLLPENCCNDKCFGIHMFISFVCIGTTQKI